MTDLIIRNARVFDGFDPNCHEGMSVRIEGDRIREISEREIRPGDSRVIDAGGRTLMPGLIDAHIHAYFADMDWRKTDLMGEAYRAAHAVRMLGFALDCGFTCVRDVGGGDHGLACAIADGLVRAPRFFYAGRMLSMTGGHGDSRHRHEQLHNQGYCSCGDANALAVVVDGVDACIKAAREEFRRGAHCIKIMASGGVASPTDPIWMNQYREDEIRAVVQEAAERRSYVSAHCHPASAIERCVAFGVRVIEHGTLIDAETARSVAEAGAYIVPTLVIIDALVEWGPRLGLLPESHEKAVHISRQALSGLEIMRTSGVKIGFGTDLLGESYVRQCDEFIIRSQVFTPLEILRQATSTNAAVLQREGELGCVAAGALADLILVDGDPLADISLLAQSGAKIPLVVRGGEIVKNRL